VSGVACAVRDARVMQQWRHYGRGGGGERSVRVCACILRHVRERAGGASGSVADCERTEAFRRPLRIPFSGRRSRWYAGNA